MDVRQLGQMGLVVVVTAIIISFGATLLVGFSQNTCTSPKTYVPYVLNGSAATSTPNNPVTGAKYGCCTTWNGTDCTNWDTTYTQNITMRGLSGTQTFGDWIPLIALVVVASIVIGVIVNYMGKQTGSV